MLMNRRPEVNGQSIVLGFVWQAVRRSYGIHAATLEHHLLVTELISLFMELQLVPEGFHFTCIQILIDAEVAPPTDKNPTDSVILPRATTREASS